MTSAILVAIALTQFGQTSDLAERIANLEIELRTPDYHNWVAARDELQEISRSGDNPSKALTRHVLDRFDQDAIDWGVSVGVPREYLTQMSSTITIELTKDVPLESFVYLYRQPLLNLIGLHGDLVSDDHVLVLSGLPNLTLLDLSSSSVQGTSLANIELPKLKILNLADTKVTDETICRAKFPSVLKLDLNGTAVTNAMLENLQMTQVKELYIANTKITVDGIKNIERLEGLERLNLDIGLINEASLPALLKHKTLKKLRIWYHDDDEERLMELQRLLDGRLMLEPVKKSVARQHNDES